MKQDIAVTKSEFFKSSEKEKLVIATPSEIEEEVSEAEIPSNKMNRKEGLKDSDDNSAPLAKKRKKGEERKRRRGGRASRNRKTGHRRRGLNSRVAFGQPHLHCLLTRIPVIGQPLQPSGYRSSRFVPIL